MMENLSPETPWQLQLNEELKSSTTQSAVDVSTEKSLRQKLKERLIDREYRHAYADESLNTYLASQIRVLREQRFLSQAQLGGLMGTTQPGVSRLEQADYDGWSIKTLKKLAEAFDVRLHISFEPFGSLWREIVYCDALHLQRPSFAADREFHASSATNADPDSFYRASPPVSPVVKDTRILTGIPPTPFMVSKKREKHNDYTSDSPKAA